MSEPFKQWAILELMGHRRLAGLVQEVQIAGHGMLRLDVPSSPPATQFYSPSAVYAITPTTEEIARRFATRERPAPVQPWELPALPAPRDERPTAATEVHGVLRRRDEARAGDEDDDASAKLPTCSECGELEDVWVARAIGDQPGANDGEIVHAICGECEEGGLVAGEEVVIDGIKARWEPTS